MAEFLLPDFNIFEESPNADLQKLLKIIKPSWNSDKLEIKTLSGGYYNKMFLCYHESNPEDSVAIRVRHVTEIVGAEKSKNKLELKVIQYLSSIGHFPKVHAIFKNGYCYQYIKGKPMIDLRARTGHVDDRMLKAIADEMAFVHSLKFEDFEKMDVGNSYFFEVFLNYLKPETRLDYGLNKTRMLKEIDLISTYFENKNSQQVLCHGDHHPGNYIWDPKEGKVTFVDWEGAHFGYQLEEIANFFLTLDGVEMVYSNENADKIIEGAYKEKFVKYYIDAWRKLNNDREKVTENDVAKWMKEIEIFSIIPLLLFSLSGLIYPESFDELGGDLNLIDMIVKDYLKLKQKLFGRGSFETE